MRLKRALAVFCSTLTAAACLIAFGGDAQGGTLNITERQSTGANNLFAGAGGAVDQRNMSSSSAALTGMFVFGDGGMVDVLDSDPFSTGTASATGIANVMDDVAQPTAGEISITASATAEGTALHLSGPSNATSQQRGRTRVRFQVIGDDAMFQLTGNFMPPANSNLVGDAVTLELRRPFTVQKKFDINSAGPVNESGTLTAGQTWEFIVHVNDKSAASQNLAMDADLFSYGLTFTVTSLPEPSTFTMLSVVPLVLLLRRPRRGRRALLDRRWGVAKA